MINEPTRRSGYETPAELSAKIDWEGGLTEAIFGYGICAADLPHQTPENVREAWQKVETVAGELEVIQKWLEPYEL